MGQYQKPSNGSTILILGIVGLVCCFPCAIVAWVMGNQSLGDIKAGRMDPREEGLVQAGRILGMVTCGLLAVTFVFYAVVFGLAFTFGATAPAPR